MNDKKNVLNGVQTVVLDLDGTLYDKSGLSRRMVRALWWSLPLMAVDRLAHGGLWRWIVSTRWHRRVYLPTMVRLIGEGCPRRESVLALVAEAKRKGLQLAIYSDYGCIREKLAVLGIDAKDFDLLISAPELGDLKPSKACAEEVLRRLQAKPETTLFVGDRDEKDGESARAVGAKFLKIN